MAARDHLVQRLVDRHGLDPDEAYAAVTQAQLTFDGPHAQLVAAEAIREMGSPELSRLRTELAVAHDPNHFARQAAEAERLSQLADCPQSRHDGKHCLHYQEGDGDCHDCGRPNWCPDGEEFLRTTETTT
jgi:hypothetical protein